MATSPLNKVELSIWMATLAALLFVPALVGESFVFLTIDFLIMALFAMSYNLLLGQSGMLSFGHAVFYGIGAYTVALLNAKLGWRPEVGIALAPITAAFAGLVIGFFCVRLSGFYFSILTLAFSQLIWAVAFGWYSFTGGDDGLPITPPEYMQAAKSYFYFVLAVVAVSIGLIRMISRSPFGAALKAIRENAERAAFIGLNVRAYRLAAFVAASAFAGLAGSLRAPLQMMAFPGLLYWTTSAEPVLMSLIGGIQAFAGPIVGAAVFVFLNFFVTGYTKYSLLLFGSLVLLLVMYLPGGVLGFVEQQAKIREKRRLGFADVRNKTKSSSSTHSPKGSD